MHMLDSARETVGQAHDTVSAVNRVLAHLARCDEYPRAAVRCSVPAGWGFFRHLQLPFGEPKKIAQVLSLELASMLPVDADAVTTDALHLTSSGKGGDKRHHLLAAAVLKKELAPCLEAIRRNGCQPPGGVTLTGLPLAQWLAVQSEFGESGLLLYGSGRQRTMFGMAGEKVCVIRVLDVGEETSGPQNLARQIARTIDWEEHFETAPGGLWLAGEPTSGPVWHRQLSEHLKMNVEPIERVARSLLSGCPQPHFFYGAGALCQSHRQQRHLLNFHRTPKGPETAYWQTHQRSIKALAAWGLLALGLWLAILVLDVHRLRNEVQSLQARSVAILRNAFPQVQKVHNPLAIMREKVQMAAQQQDPAWLAANRPPALDLLNEISQMIPPALKVVIDRMVIGTDRIDLNGHGESFDHVHQIAANLRQSDLFAASTITNTRKDAGAQKVYFSMQVEIASPLGPKEGLNDSR